MACFLVTAAEAVVVTVAAQAIKRSEKKNEIRPVKLDGETRVSAESSEVSIPWSRKLMWLSYLLWGGALLLAFEHIWHGEVVPWFPFLTAAADPGDTAEMLHEMSTVGVSMALMVTAAWGVMVAAVQSLIKKITRTGTAAA
ncbi:MAG: hypothetical protein Q4E91_09415 [Lachnospiraceae bacterium]|nr:hypothetical protein [Lachnospiraceae bacterium]